MNLSITPKWAKRLVGDGDWVRIDQAPDGELLLLPTGTKLCKTEGQYIICGYTADGEDVFSLFTEEELNQIAGEMIADLEYIIQRREREIDELFRSNREILSSLLP